MKCWMVWFWNQYDDQEIHVCATKEIADARAEAMALSYGIEHQAEDGSWRDKLDRPRYGIDVTEYELETE